MKNRQIPTFANLIPHHVFVLGGGKGGTKGSELWGEARSRNHMENGFITCICTEEKKKDFFNSFRRFLIKAKRKDLQV